MILIKFNKLQDKYNNQIHNGYLKLLTWYSSEETSKDPDWGFVILSIKLNFLKRRLNWMLIRCFNDWIELLYSSLRKNQWNIIMIVIIIIHYYYYYYHYFCLLDFGNQGNLPKMDECSQKCLVEALTMDWWWLSRLSIMLRSSYNASCGSIDHLISLACSVGGRDE